MKEDWEAAIAFTLKMEGGDAVENNPDDPGRKTRYGISQKAYPSEDIDNLTLDRAKELYLRDYWTPCGCDDLPRSLAISVFDCAVNMGVTKAKRLLQMALKLDVVDGVIGPKTIARAAQADHNDVKRYLAERLAEYTRIIVANQKLIVFSLNWNYRVVSLTDVIFVH